MVYAARIHTEGDAGVTTQVVSLHSSPEGARRAVETRLREIADLCYEGGYRPCVVWDECTPHLAEVLELDTFNIVQGTTDWSGTIKAMQVLP